MLKNHIQKENLHHAYLITANPDNVLENLLKILASFGIAPEQNPDFHSLNFDTLKIDDARAIKSLTEDKSFSGGKKIFLISTNQFLPEAQNSLLKIFEEPKDGMHFFIISKNADSFLPTLRSRCYLISLEKNIEQNAEKKSDLEKFLNSTLQNKIDYIKNLLDTDEDKGESSARTQALGFLDALELALHANMSKMTFDTGIFSKIFIARKYIRQPGSSPKNILEAIVLNLPEKISS